MRKLVYYVACSVDLFIARVDGSYDFLLQEGEQFTDLIEAFPETFPTPARTMLGIQGEKQRFDSVLMGRETFDTGAKPGLTSPYPQLQQFVYSRTLRESPDPQIVLIADDPATHVTKLKEYLGRCVVRPDRRAHHESELGPSRLWQDADCWRSKADEAGADQQQKLPQRVPGYVKRVGSSGTPVLRQNSCVVASRSAPVSPL